MGIILVILQVDVLFQGDTQPEQKPGSVPGEAGVTYSGLGSKGEVIQTAGVVDLRSILALTLGVWRGRNRVETVSGEGKVVDTGREGQADQNDLSIRLEGCGAGS